MYLRVLALAAVLSCGGSESDPAADATAPDAAASFASVADEYAAAYCDSEALCGGGDDGACLIAVAEQMDLAEAELDGAAEVPCIACMRAWIDAFRAFAEGNCALDALDLTAVNAACDFDPEEDWDGNGLLSDSDQACAGYPYPPE